MSYTVYHQPNDTGPYVVMWEYGQEEVFYIVPLGTSKFDTYRRSVEIFQTKEAAMEFARRESEVMDVWDLV